MNFANVGKLRVKQMSNGDRFVLMPFYEGKPELLLPKNLLKQPYNARSGHRHVREVLLAKGNNKLSYNVFLKPILIKGFFENEYRQLMPSHEARIISELLSHGFKAETPLGVYFFNIKKWGTKTDWPAFGGLAGYLITKKVEGKRASTADAKSLEQQLKQAGFVTSDVNPKHVLNARHVIKNKSGLFIVDAESFQTRDFINRRDSRRS